MKVALVAFMLYAVAVEGFLPRTSSAFRARGSIIAKDAKMVVYRDEARKKLVTGINAVANAVKITLGPKGRNVVLQRQYGAPEIVNDGVTIAKAIELEDPQENAGARLIQEVASKSDNKAGDGTTTSTLLAQELVNKGMRTVSSGANPVAIRRAMQDTAAEIITKIKGLAKPVKNNADLLSIATVATSGNADMGGLIAKAFEMVGETGSTVVEESQTIFDEIECTEGYTLDRGYMSPYFANKDKDRHTCELVKPRVLVTDKRITNLQEMLPLLEGIAKSKESLLIIADDVTGEALSALVVNKLRGVLDVCAIKAPGFGNRRKELLQDLCVATGATFISDEVGLTLESAKPEMLGSADRAVVTKDRTTIVNDGKQAGAIAARIEELKKDIEDCTSKYDEDKLKERLATLGGGIARIKIGAATETELKDKKLRYEDALNSVKSAIEMGVVPGGGATLLYLSRFHNEVKQALVKKEEARTGTSVDDDYVTGIDIVFKSLSAPMMQIAENAGVDGEVAVGKCLDKDFGFGFNAATGIYQDLIAAGILDPAKVTITAMENSVSVASLVLTTEALVTDIPKKSSKKKRMSSAEDYDDEDDDEY